MCEMLFSYGFIEDSMKSAKQLFLGLDIPDDDPLKMAKIHITNTAPGFTVYEQNDGVSWESDFVWLICVNEEDGLAFRVSQSNDGSKELEVSWQEKELTDISALRELLQHDEKWDLFHLRAITLLQTRITEQLETLRLSANLVECAAYGTDFKAREQPYKQAVRLRKHEESLLKMIFEELERKVRDTLTFSNLTRLN
jgi:hypothetical protein